MRAEFRATRIYWAKFAVATSVYMMFAPALDLYFDHLVWSVLQPQGRFGGTTYDLIEIGAGFFPIAFHGVGSWLNGWLAANATVLLLSAWLSAATVWVAYPLTSVHSAWLDPLFRPGVLPWPSYGFAALVLIASTLSLFSLGLLSPPGNGGRVRRVIGNYSTAILSLLLCILLLGMR